MSCLEIDRGRVFCKLIAVNIQFCLGSRQAHTVQKLLISLISILWALISELLLLWSIVILFVVLQQSPPSQSQASMLFSSSQKPSLYYLAVIPLLFTSTRGKGRFTPFLFELTTLNQCILWLSGRWEFGTVKLDPRYIIAQLTSYNYVAFYLVPRYKIPGTMYYV